MLIQSCSLVKWNICLLPLLGLFVGKYESRSIVLPEDKKQMHLVVAIHSSIPHDVAIKNGGLVKSIESLLNTTSSLLFTATRRSQYIQEVTILVPYHLKSEFNEIKQATYETFADADIQVDDHGENNSPYTIRSEGCGKPGRAIHLSPNFIFPSATSNEPEAYAKRLVRELAFYQYGVFDECGYKSDAHFPAFYYNNGNLQPTGCSSKIMHGNLEGDCQLNNHTRLPNPDCDFIPDEHHGTSSIVYQPTWHNANEFCDTDSHNSEAPTKQNILCDGKSTWEVITRNPNFDTEELPPTTPTIPKFNIVYESDASYYILLDESLAMKSSNKFQTAIRVLTNFFSNDVPVGSNVGLGTIADSIFPRRDMRKITDENSRTSLSNAMPDNVLQIPDANVDSGIDNGCQRLQSYPRGELILITAGKWMIPDVDKLCQTLSNQRVRLMTILYTEFPHELNVEVKDSLHRLTSCSNGKIYVIPKVREDNQPSSVERLKIALRESLQPNELPQENIDIYEKHYHHSQTTTIKGNFTIGGSDNGQGIVTTFRVTYHETNNVDAVTLKGPDGSHHDYSGNDYFKERSIQEVSYKFEMHPGVWTYNIRLYEGLEQHPLATTVSSHIGKKKSVTVNVWTNAHSEINATESPVIVYAEVKYGHEIVTDAVVIATVYEPNKISTAHKLQLFDNGNGDPDISKNDGIYSRYFTQLTSAGYYAIYVRVTGIKQKTLAFVKTSSPYEITKSAICTEPIYSAEDIGSFQRLAIGPAFYVTEPIVKDNHDYPPNRITDLRLDNIFTKNGTIALQWTAPGDDYDFGIADRFEIRYDKSRDNLLAHRFESAVLFTNLQIIPKPANTEMTALVQLPLNGNSYYIAIRSFDRNNIKSAVSNVVLAYYPANLTPPPEKPGINGSIHYNETINVDKGEKTANVGPIIGIIVGAILLLVILVVVWRVTTNRRKRHRQDQLKTDYKKVNKEEKKEAANKDEENNPSDETTEIGHRNAVNDGDDDGGFKKF